MDYLRVGLACIGAAIIIVIWLICLCHFYCPERLPPPCARMFLQKEDQPAKS